MNYGAPDSIGEAFEKYKNALIEHGFAVKPGENGEDIFYGNQFLATVKIDSESMVFDLALGNEGLTDLDKAGKVEPENIYALGDVIKNDYVRLQLNKFATAKELRSGKSSTGYYFTYGSASGDPLFHLTGTFKNLGNARVDIRNTYITFTFDDQYTYPGKMTGVVKDTGFFVEDVSPLSDVTCYLYAEVPEKVIKNFKSNFFVVQAFNR